MIIIFSQDRQANTNEAQQALQHVINVGCTFHAYRLQKNAVS